MPPADPAALPSTLAVIPLPEQVGRYRVLAQLGAGGMGTVYRAHDPQLDRVVALKLPHFEGPPDSRIRRVQRFHREARTAAQVWHPHVCPIYDVGEQEGQPFVVMPLVTGQTLAARLAAGRFEDPGEAVRLVLQLLDALNAVHACGIIHRDLKPGNVMLDASGRAILMDFGLARPDRDSEPLTSDGIVLGTPAYMAPEQAAGQSDRIGPWTDLYSLGVVLYQMLTGRIPFDGPPLTVLHHILHEAPPPPHELRPDLDPALEAVLLEALTRESTARYQTAAEFAAALAGWLRASGRAAQDAVTVSAVLRPADNRTEALGVEPDSLPRRPPRRSRGLVLDWLTATVIFLCMLALVVLVGITSVVSRMDLTWLTGVCLMATICVVAAGAFLTYRQLRPRATNRSQEVFAAAEDGRLEALRRLIRAGVDLEGRDEMGETALMKAAERGYIGITKMLLANGAQVNATNPFGETALTLANRQGRAYIVELLRQAGARE